MESILSDGTVVRDLLDVEQTSIGSNADLPQSGQVLQAFAEGEITRVVDSRFGAQGASFFVILLDARVLVIDMQGRCDALGNDGFVGACRDGVCCGVVNSPAEQESPRLCPHCENHNILKNGRDRRGTQLYRCADCRRSFTARTGTPFSGHSFPPAVIDLAVRWYLRFRLSYAEVVEWLAERHIPVNPSTVFDWVHETSS